MNRILLMALCAAMSFGAQAQKKISPSDVSEASVLKMSGQASATRAMNIGSMYYYRPCGLFYSGWNRDLRNADVAYAPVSTPVVYQPACTGGTPVWVFPAGTRASDTDEQQGGTLEITLAEGTYPCVSIYDADDTSVKYSPVSKMVAGGATGKNVTGGKILDAYAVNYVPEGNLHSMSAYFSTANPDADARLADVLQAEDLHVRGFGERFVPSAPMKVMGFEMLVLGDDKLMETPGKVLPSIMVYDGQNGYQELKTSEDFEVEVSPIEGLQSMYELLFTLTGDPLVIEAGQTIMPLASSEDIWFTPLFDAQTRFDADSAENLGITTMCVSADISGSHDYLSLKGLSIEDNTGAVQYINSWCIGLHMSYEAVDAGITDVRPDTPSSSTYTLSGTRVGGEPLHPGIYIRNNKKVIIR